MNKCVSAAEAVSAVKSGMTIGIGGWGAAAKAHGARSRTLALGCR